MGVKPFSFSNWQTRAAEKARAVAEASNRAEAFDPDVWSVLKAHLFDLFGGRCAFCDSDVLAVANGDVEHFRPKRKVDGDPGHPGYYWLAYDPTNFLPACEKCNRPNKKNEFPVEDGTRAYAPDGIQDEQPLLLNPYFDDPIANLDCDDFGVMKGTTPRGSVSVKVYGLNRPDLVDLRRKAIEALGTTYKLRMVAATSESEALRVLHAELRQGATAYSAALVRAYLRILKRRLEAEEEILRGAGQAAEP